MELTTIKKLNIPQFKHDVKAAINFFNDYGFHIEDNVLSEFECKEAIDQSFFSAKL